MVVHLENWKVALERVWSAASIDCPEAGRLVAEIAASDADEPVRQAARQAMPTLRHALLDPTDNEAAEAARRRIGVVVDLLREQTAPRFGRRGAVSKPLTAEQGARQMLGLPLAGHLAGAEIHHAFKLAAKRVHPDGGGSEKEFLDLTAARDALIKRPEQRG
jgi:hypothetical protein